MNRKGELVELVLKSEQELTTRASISIVPDAAETAVMEPALGAKDIEPLPDVGRGSTAVPRPEGLMICTRCNDGKFTSSDKITRLEEQLADALRITEELEDRLQRKTERAEHNDQQFKAALHRAKEEADRYRAGEAAALRTLQETQSALDALRQAFEEERQKVSQSPSTAALHCGRWLTPVTRSTLTGPRNLRLLRPFAVDHLAVLTKNSRKCISIHPPESRQSRPPMRPRLLATTVARREFRSMRCAE